MRLKYYISIDIEKFILFVRFESKCIVFPIYPLFEFDVRVILKDD